MNEAKFMLREHPYIKMYRIIYILRVQWVLPHIAHGNGLGIKKGLVPIP